MAIVDFIPVVLFFISAVILQRDLYNKMSKGSFALLAAGSIMVLLAGFYKAAWKALYALGVCDFAALNTSFFPMQAPGFLLVFLGLLSMGNGTKTYAVAAPAVYSSNLIFIIGRIIIGKILKIIDKSSFTQKMEPTVKSFLHSFIKIGLYVILVISIINVLGVPMASVITVLASAGVAVGLALQGALTNLAGGILIMLLRPFKVGDYVASAGEEGVVKEITLFYTTLLTVDNRRIIIPQGLVVALPNICNTTINLLKSTSLAFMMTVKDIMAIAKMDAAFGYNYIEAYLVVLAIYIILCTLVQILFKVMEGFLSGYRRRITA